MRPDIGIYSMKLSTALFSLVQACLVSLSGGSRPSPNMVHMMNVDEIRDTFGHNTEFYNIPHHTLVHSRGLQKSHLEDEFFTKILHDMELPSDFGTQPTKLTSLEFMPVHEDIWAPNVVQIERDEPSSRMFVGQLENHSDECHFQTAHNRSDGLIAAVSTCDGFMRGVIIHSGAAYLLHPLPKRLQTKGENYHGEGVHVVYKRNAVLPSVDSDLNVAGQENTPDFCGIESSFSDDDFLVEDSAIHDHLPDIAVIANRLTEQSDLVVELGIFIDQQLWNRFRQREGSAADSRLRHFVGTAINNIQIIYKQSSMQPPLHFTITHYEVYKSQPYALDGRQHNNGHAQKYLHTFCKHQRKQTGRWDHAFLMSGYDLHQGVHSRSISGIARLHGMCDAWNTCTVTEGLDFTSVFIGAHELGHSVGMAHDEPYCSSTYIMSASLGPGKTTWSTCSMRDYHKFIQKLDYRNSNCLRKTTSSVVLNYEDGSRPGQRYTADQQCSMMHGDGYKHVQPRRQSYDGLCYMMWCGKHKYGRIITSHPALEGTHCKQGHWCQQGRCVPATGQTGSNTVPSTSGSGSGSGSGTTSGSGRKPWTAPKKEDGQWSAWPDPDCSGCTCAPFSGAIGVVPIKRTCNNPRPKNGGRECSGTETIGVICKDDCSSVIGNKRQSIEDYMKSVCTYYRDTKRDYELTGAGAQLTRHRSRSCKVFCVVQNSFNTNAESNKNYRYFGDSLPDGTPCGQSNSYCIAGECLTRSCSSQALSLYDAGCPPSQCSRNSWAKLLDTSHTRGGTSSSGGRWSSWSAWSHCSVTCGEGSKRRARYCSGGSDCTGGKEENEVCVERQCSSSRSTPAYWSSWHSWSACSSTCGRGEQRRERTCVGSGCGGDRWQRQRCDAGWCPWSTWSVCSTSCGQGTRRRTRSCPNSGQCLGGSSEDERCRNNPDCKTYGSWSDWSDCSATCGDSARRRRVRHCFGPACRADDKQNEDQQCSWLADCRTSSHPRSTSDWSAWSSWTPCSATCGAGVQARYRRCRGGSNCPGDTNQRKDCRASIQCDGEDNSWGDWSVWTGCSATCDKGVQLRERRCALGNDRCTGISKQSLVCDANRQCPQKSDRSRASGRWSTWSDWSSCSSTCSGGMKSRQRVCSGTCTGLTLDTVDCNGHISCPGGSNSNSDVTSWGAWSACSATCGGGQRQRFATCGNRAQCQKHVADCNEHDCSTPIGDWGSWGQWSQCSMCKPICRGTSPPTETTPSNTPPPELRAGRGATQTHLPRR